MLTARWPELWLLDEPHAGLDASARDALDLLIGDAGAAGVTVLIASHETGSVESLAARAVTVTGGRVTGGRAIVGPSVARDPRPAPAQDGVGTAGPDTGADRAPGAGRPAGEVAHVA